MSDLSTTAGKLADLQNRLEESKQPLGHEPAARTLVTQLVDPGTFVEVDALARHRVEDLEPKPATDGIVAGYGTIEGRKVCVFAQDASIFAGNLGEVSGEKIVKIQQMALKSGVPLVGYLEGTGVRAAEGIGALHFYATIIAEMAQASGVIPQVILTGETLGGPNELLPHCADFVIGRGADAHLHAENVDAAVAAARQLLGYLPANNRAEAPRPLEARLAGPAESWISEKDLALDEIVPDDPAQALDVAAVVGAIVDTGSFLELQAEVGGSMATGVARIEGRVVGIIANNGPLSAAGLTKAARFVRTCDALGLQLVQFVDASSMPTDPATVKAAAQLSFALAAATVGKLTVVLRAAMGTAYTVLGAKGLGTDLLFAWPTAEIAALPASDAVPELHAAQLAKAERRGKDVAALRAELESAYDAQALTPYAAAERGVVDSVIAPSHTRGQLVEGLRLLDRKVVYGPAKKHANIQL